MIAYKIEDVTAHWKSNDVIYHACYDKNFPFLKPKRGVLTVYTPTIAEFTPFKENTDTLDKDFHWPLDDDDIIADTKEECVAAYNQQIQKEIDKITRKYNRDMQRLKSRMA